MKYTPSAPAVADNYSPIAKPCYFQLADTALKITKFYSINALKTF